MFAKYGEIIYVAVQQFAKKGRNRQCVITLYSVFGLRLASCACNVCMDTCIYVVRCILYTLTCTCIDVYMELHIPLVIAHCPAFEYLIHY